MSFTQPLSSEWVRHQSSWHFGRAESSAIFLISWVSNIWHLVVAHPLSGVWTLCESLKLWGDQRSARIDGMGDAHRRNFQLGSCFSLESFHVSWSRSPPAVSFQNCYCKLFYTTVYFHRLSCSFFPLSLFLFVDLNVFFFLGLHVRLFLCMILQPNS